MVGHCCYQDILLNTSAQVCEDSKTLLLGPAAAAAAATSSTAVPAELSCFWCQSAILTPCTPTYEEACSLPAWQYLLVSCAGIQHPFQLQLAQLALLNHLCWQRVPQRVL
jgi:hypothetical protein